EQSARPGRSAVGSVLQHAGYRMALISGATERRAEVLTTILPDDAQVLLNQSPNDPFAKSEQPQQLGAKVCMLGDGLNDAGALRKADLGIAVSDDINNFSPGCDAILDGASFSKLPDFLRFSKDAVKVIKMSFAISIAYNIIGLSFAVQ